MHGDGEPCSQPVMPPEAATLFKELAGYLKPEDVSRLESAYHFSEAAHSGQFRASGEPYVPHPLAVANILAQLHLDPQALTAALLHDVMEDTAVTKDEIASTFGRPVADLVTVRANGRKIGVGTLVEVDGRVGVMLTELAGPGRAS